MVGSGTYTTGQNIISFAPRAKQGDRELLRCNRLRPANYTHYNHCTPLRLGASLTDTVIYVQTLRPLKQS